MWTGALGPSAWEAAQDPELALLGFLQSRPAHGSASVTPQVETLLTELSLRGIRVPRPSEARGYLVGHPDILDLVRCVAIDASERLGSTAQLSLELHQDPEIAYQYLVLYVRQECYDDGILETIDEILAPHEAALVATSGWFLATTDFKPPVVRP
jgi:hypothetical protein